MSAAAKSPNGRDAFAEARENFMLDVIRRASGDAAARVGFALAIGFASRREFEKTGRLVAWPSMRTLAEYTGLFKGKIERGIKSLEKTGHIVVERPETRGAGHHNTYVMKIPNVLADGDIKVLRDVDNPTSDKVLADGDISEGANVLGNGDINVLTGEDAMSSEIGPNLIDDPLSGDGAQSRQSPYAPDGGEVVDVEAHDPDATAAASAGAAKRARLTGGGSLADRALEAQRLVPASAPETEPDPASAHFKAGADVTLDELDRLHAAARDALARQDAARALGDALELFDHEADEFAPEVINWLAQGDADARATVVAAVVEAVDGAAEGREGRWKIVVRAVRRVVTTEYSGERGIALADAAEVALREATRPIFRERDARRKAAKVREVEESKNV